MNYDGATVNADWYHNHGWKFNGDRYVSPTEQRLAQYSLDLKAYYSLPWWRRLVTRKPQLPVSTVKDDLPHD